MCTVSFIPKGKSFIFTSNRDEHISRPSAFVPQEEVVNGRKLIFPKDPKAGGTWFAISEVGAVAVLLNGAFKKHVSKGNYAKSRGLVVLDIISNEDPHAYLNTINLKNIEPFTILVFQNACLMQLRWDGTDKHLKKLDSSKNHIWSSATLYDSSAMKNREELFASFTEKGTPDSGAIIDFHSNNNKDFENGFVIERKTGLKTFSVTQAILDKEKVTLQHIDLLKEEKHMVKLLLNQLINH